MGLPGVRVPVRVGGGWCSPHGSKAACGAVQVRVWAHAGHPRMPPSAHLQQLRALLLVLAAVLPLARPASAAVTSYGDCGGFAPPGGGGGCSAHGMRPGIKPAFTPVKVLEDARHAPPLPLFEPQVGQLELRLEGQPVVARLFQRLGGGEGAGAGRMRSGQQGRCCRRSEPEGTLHGQPAACAAPSTACYSHHHRPQPASNAP